MARPRRRVVAPARAAGRLLLATFVAVVVALSAGPAVAAPAHGGGGQITLVKAEATSADTVAVEVCVTFTLDRDQADTARVTMGASGPGDEVVDARPMEVGDQPGLRTGEVTFPSEGSWTIQVQSTFPPATLAVPVTIGGDLPLDAGVGAPPTSATVAASCAPADDALPSWLVAGLGTSAAVILFGGLLLLLRRATEPPGGDGPAAETAGGEDESGAAGGDGDRPHVEGDRPTRPARDVRP